MYDSRQEAESARQRLSSAVDVEQVKIFDQSSGGSSDGSSSFGSGSSSSDGSTSGGSTSSGSTSSGLTNSEGRMSGTGIGSWLSNLFVSDDDRPAYEEGVRRGGFMLCAEVDGDEDADKIVQILEETSAFDLDERQQNWRSEGWEGRSSQQSTTSGGQGFMAGSQNFGDNDRSFGSTEGSSDRSFAGTEGSSDQSFGSTGGSSDRTIEEERIPIMQEELRVGKRQVDRGGARVRSYMRETPVSEQVNLREENISVERRPVNESISSNELGGGDMLQDREIEMHATGEEAVIGKDARVTEELVVRKTADEHRENVQDTVRHTEVDVDNDLRETTDTTGGSSSAPWGNDDKR
jgi:uncharacterized protein (TIGR02271 family)